MDDPSFARGLGTGHFGEAGQQTLELAAEHVAALLRDYHGGLVFTNVSVRGDLKLQETEVVAFARFVNCTFSSIQVERATLRGSLAFSGCKIGRFRGHHTHFNDLRVTGGEMRDFTAANSTFDKTCVFRRVKISRIFLPASQIAGNLRIKDLTADEVDVRRVRVSGLCDLRKLRARNLAAEGLSAQRIDAGGVRATNVSFDRVIVKDAIDLSDMRIADSLNMRSAEIGDDIYLNRCVLNDVYMSGTKSGDALFIKDSVIFGELEIIEGKFGQFECTAKICGAIHISDASFSAAYLASVRFHSDFLFVRNTVAGTLLMDSDEKIRPSIRGRCTFANSSVGGQTLVNDVVVKDELSFASLTTTDLLCAGLSLASDLRLAGLTASQRVRLTSSTVKGDVIADSLAAMQLLVSQCTLGSLKLASANVKGSVELDDVGTPTLIASHVEIGADLALKSARIGAALDLTRARVGDLRFEDQMTEGAGGFRFPPRTTLKHCEYDSIRVSWPDLIAALDADREYDATAYRILETYIRTLGRLDWADQVYLCSRRHAVQTLPPGRKRLGEQTLDWISGYGARPLRLLRVALAIYAIMWFVVLFAKSTSSAFLNYSNHQTLGAMLQVSTSAVDVVLRGEKSDVLAALAGQRRSWSVLLMDVALGLRFVIAAAVGLLAAYFTGLVRYHGGGGKQ